jgi:IS1 family transposase
MLVRDSGIRDISTVLHVSIKKVLSVLTKSSYQIKPKQTHYDNLELDEFYTYVVSKMNRFWLIYAYHRDSGEIVAFVWGKRNQKTAQKLRDRIKSPGLTYDTSNTDNWNSFIAVFQQDNFVLGKTNTVGIEGNNCRLRYRIRRAFRKTCCFSKKLYNHLKAFNLAFFYINFGHL